MSNGHIYFHHTLAAVANDEAEDVSRFLVAGITIEEKVRVLFSMG